MLYNTTLAWNKTRQEQLLATTTKFYLNTVRNISFKKNIHKTGLHICCVEAFGFGRGKLCSDHKK